MVNKLLMLKMLCGRCFLRLNQLEASNSHHTGRGIEGPSIASFLSSSPPPRLLFLTADGFLLGYKVLYFPSLLHQVSRRWRDQRQGQALSESHRGMVGINELTYSDMFQKVKCSLSVRRD